MVKRFGFEGEAGEKPGGMGGPAPAQKSLVANKPFVDANGAKG
jgi:hypothetical protein